MKRGHCKEAHYDLRVVELAALRFLKPYCNLFPLNFEKKKNCIFCPHLWNWMLKNDSKIMILMTLFIFGRGNSATYDEFLKGNNLYVWNNSPWWRSSGVHFLDQDDHFVADDGFIVLKNVSLWPWRFCLLPGFASVKTSLYNVILLCNYSKFE